MFSVPICEQNSGQSKESHISGLFFLEKKTNTGRFLTSTRWKCFETSTPQIGLDWHPPPRFLNVGIIFWSSDWHPLLWKISKYCYCPIKSSKNSHVCLFTSLQLFANWAQITRVNSGIWEVPVPGLYFFEIRQSEHKSEQGLAYSLAMIKVCTWRVAELSFCPVKEKYTLANLLLDFHFTMMYFAT